MPAQLVQRLHRGALPERLQDFGGYRCEQILRQSQGADAVQLVQLLLHGFQISRARVGSQFLQQCRHKLGFRFGSDARWQQEGS